MEDDRRDPGEPDESWSEEIHRRRLWQVTVGYLAGGWALVEVIDILVGQSILPASVFRGALVLLVIGFPVVLGTAFVQSAPRGAESRRVTGLLTWRNAILGGVGAFALLGLFTAGSALVRTAGFAGDRAEEIEPNRVAVFPFDVSGAPDLAYLGEGIVDLVSARLDGAGEITAVDPRVVIAAAREREVDPADPADPDATDRLAALLRAGRFVTGDLFEAGSRVRLSAHVHTTGGADRSLRTASVEGARDSVFPLLDDLVARLLAEIVSEDADRLDARATLTTESLDAARAYLEGERLLRAGRYRAAARSYERAIELDSAFALAHYRRTIAADWIDAYDIRTSAERAMAHADRLSPREREILEAVRLRRNGKVAEAEHLFRGRLHQDADDVEVLVQYGELLFHDIGRLGRSPTEAIVPFQRALDLEPANEIARVHLARLYALVDSATHLERVTRGAAELDLTNEHAAELQALRVSAAPDSVDVASVRAMLEDAPYFHRFYAGHAIVNYGQDPRFAKRLLAGHEDDNELLRFLDLKADVQLGRWAAAREFLDQPAIRDQPTWRLLEVLLAGIRVLDHGRDDLEDLVAFLENVPVEEVLRSSWVPPYEDVTPRFIAFELDYFRALLLVRLGRLEEARATLATLRASEPFPGLGSIRSDALASLEAELLYAAGDLNGALASAREMALEVPHSATVRYLADASRARYLRAELEAAVGDPETARAFYLGLDEAWSPWDSFYRPRVYERLGALAEGEGDEIAAIEYYTRFIDMWADCDPALVPARDSVQARRDALVRARG